MNMVRDKWITIFLILWNFEHYQKGQALKIYLASDLHIEIFGDVPLPNSAIDVVVLAGDIHNGDKVFDVAAKFRRHCHAPVLIVAGNHEYYHHDYVEQLNIFRRDATKLRNIFFLENKRVDLEGVRFLGCTFWSNFALYGKDQVLNSQVEALERVADFSVTRYGGLRFTPIHAAALHAESYAWLEEELAKPFDGKTVVVTHFLPHRAGIHSCHGNGDALTPYFTSDCSTLMRRYSIAAWLYGHTHNSIDVVVENGTRLVSNQRGYPNEHPMYTLFDPTKVIDI